MTRPAERRCGARTLASITCVLLLGCVAGIAQERPLAADTGADSEQSGAAGLAAAVSVVRRLHSALVDASALEGVEARFEFLEDEIAATHDLEFIGRLTVRRQWREFSESQRSDFTSSFQRLSVMSYAARFLNVDAGSFEPPVAESMSGGRIQVKSGIARADGSTVVLEYLLQNEDSGWRIVNVIADGVSDIALKRAEYQALYESGGFDALVGEIETQTRDLAESVQT
jgi:phospholipid transport system substrate-binding protein